MDVTLSQARERWSEVVERAGRPVVHPPWPHRAGVQAGSDRAGCPTRRVTLKRCLRWSRPCGRGWSGPGPDIES